MTQSVLTCWNRASLTSIWSLRAPVVLLFTSFVLPIFFPLLRVVLPLLLEFKVPVAFNQEALTFSSYGGKVIGYLAGGVVLTFLRHGRIVVAGTWGIAALLVLFYGFTFCFAYLFFALGAAGFAYALCKLVLFALLGAATTNESQPMFFALAIAIQETMAILYEYLSDELWDQLSGAFDLFPSLLYCFVALALLSIGGIPLIWVSKEIRGVDEEVPTRIQVLSDLRNASRRLLHVGALLGSYAFADGVAMVGVPDLIAGSARLNEWHARVLMTVFRPSGALFIGVTGFVAALSFFGPRKTYLGGAIATAWSCLIFWILLMLSLHNFSILLVTLSLGGIGKLFVLSSLYCAVANASSRRTMALTFGLMLAWHGLVSIIAHFCVIAILMVFSVQPWLILVTVVCWTLVAFVGMLFWISDLELRWVDREERAVQMSHGSGIQTDHEGDTTDCEQEPENELL